MAVMNDGDVDLRGRDAANYKKRGNETTVDRAWRLASMSFVSSRWHFTADVASYTVYIVLFASDTKT